MSGTPNGPVKSTGVAPPKESSDVINAEVLFDMPSRTSLLNRGENWLVAPTVYAVVPMLVSVTEERLRLCVYVGVSANLKHRQLLAKWWSRRTDVESIPLGSE